MFTPKIKTGLDLKHAADADGILSQEEKNFIAKSIRLTRQGYFAAFRTNCMENCMPVKSDMQTGLRF